MYFYNPDYLNRLFLTLSVCTQCNMHCEYCCNSYFMKEDKHMMNEKELDLILRGLSFSKLPIELSIQGGEPALYPKLCDLIEKACSIKKIVEVGIISNGTIPLNLKYNPKISLCLSYHSYKINDRQKQVFKENYEKYSKIFHGVYILNMLYRDYKSDIYELIPNGNILPKPVFENDNISMNISEIDEIQNDDVKNTDDVYILNGQEYTYMEVFKQHLNQFKGWKCHMNIFFTDPWGNVRMGCTNEIVTNILKNPTYFAFNKGQTIICPKNECVFDCLLACKKEK